MAVQKLITLAKGNPALKPFYTVARNVVLNRRFEQLKRDSIKLVSEIQKIPYTQVQHDEGKIETDAFNQDERNFAIVEINNTCNIDCLMCKTSLSTRQKGVIKDLVFKQALDRLKKIGINRLSLHTIGDPLANSRLGQIFAILREYGIKANLSTNGLLLHKHVDTLLDYMDLCHHIRFSIDGASKRVYEKIRAGGNWEQLNENLDLFKQKMAVKSYGLSINMTMSKDNCHEVGALIEHFRSYVDTPYENLRINMINSLSPDPSYFDEVNLFPHHTYKNLPCNFVTQPMPYVHIDGRVSICCRDYDGSMVLGDLQTQTLQEIHSNKSLQNLRAAHRTGDLAAYPLCDTCYVIDRRVDNVYSNLIRYILYKHPDAPGTYYQEKSDEFIRLFQEKPDANLPELYGKLYTN